MRFIKLSLICLAGLSCFSSGLLTANVRQSGAFPIIRDVIKGESEVVGQMHLYPEYVEIHDTAKNLVFRAGILSDRGEQKIFMALAKEPPKLIAYAKGYEIFDLKGQLIGGYFWTPTYAYVYSLSGERVGKVKCLSWSRICGAVTAVYLLLAA